jgi:hypothetical protein
MTTFDKLAIGFVVWGLLVFAFLLWFHKATRRSAELDDLRRKYRPVPSWEEKL